MRDNNADLRDIKQLEALMVVVKAINAAGDPHGFRDLLYDYSGKYGSRNAHTSERIKWVDEACKHKTYPALWHSLADPDFVSEFNRWVRAEAAKKSPVKGKRKSRNVKIALITDELKKNPNATAVEIEKATGIDESGVRQVWNIPKKMLRKRDIPRGSKSEGQTEAVDTSASCCYCQIPVSTSFECSLCKEIISGECKTCHYTNIHPLDAMP